MSSETFAIVSCALRTSGPSAAPSTRPASTPPRPSRPPPPGPHPPQPATEADHALDPRVLPLLVVLRGPHVEDVEPNGLRAVTLHHLVGRDDVPLRLGHLRALVIEHPLVEEPRKRLLEADDAEVVHDLR